MSSAGGTTTIMKVKRFGAQSDLFAVLTINTGPLAQDQQNFVRVGKFFSFYLELYKNKFKNLIRNSKFKLNFFRGLYQFETNDEPHRWCNGQPARLECGRSWMGAPDRVKPKTLKIVCVASPLSIKEKKSKAGWFRIRIMCPSGATCLSADCCSVSQHYKSPTRGVGLVQMDLIIISLTINLFSP